MDTFFPKKMKMKNAQLATRNEVNKQETTVRHKNDKKVLQMLETKDFSFIEASKISKWRSNIVLVAHNRFSYYSSPVLLNSL